MTVYLNGVARAVGASISEGMYTGDGSVNRAIPHGLGVTPDLVVLTNKAAYMYFIFGGTAKVLYVTTASSGQIAVTAPDATNFYIGNASEYFKSANSNAVAYQWAAFG